MLNSRMRKKSRNPKHLKIHIIAVSIISAIIIALFLLLGGRNKPVIIGGPTEIIGSRFITIDSATWGRNCDEFIDQALATWTPPAEPTDSDTVNKDAAIKPHRAALNNALPALRKACDHTITCRLPVTSESFGDNPLPSCFKRLTVGYRCFSYDRLQTLDFGEGETLSINCHEAADSKQ